MAAPPTNLREATAWAARREPTDVAELDSLLPRGTLDAPRMAARIRAAALVGGEHALGVIAAFGDPEGTWPDQVARELIAAWSRWDRAEFARRVFAENHRLCFQYAGFLDRLDGIEHIPGLESVTLAVKRSCSLAPLARCERLRGLAVNLAYGSDDLSPLGSCARLTALELWSSELVEASQWAALGGLGRVMVLKIALGREVGLGVIAGMSALRTVELSIAREALSAEDRAVLGDLLGRGVSVHAHQREGWTRALPAGLPPGARVHRAAGQITIRADGR